MPASTNIEIKMRFFEALDKLIELGLVSSNARFCVKYDLDRRNLAKSRKEPALRIDNFLLSAMVVDFRVSAHWLLTGKGKMFGDSKD